MTPRKPFSMLYCGHDTGDGGFEPFVGVQDDGQTTFPRLVTALENYRIEHGGFLHPEQPVIFRRTIR